MSKTNLCIVGLSKQFTDNVCKLLSIKMDMFYASIEEIFAYELMDIEKIEEICGLDYLIKEEKSIIRRVCGYENTLINIDYSLLNNDEILNEVDKNCLIIYLSLTEERFEKEQLKENVSSNLMSINKEVFCDRDFLCKNISDITINCEEINLDNLVTRITEQILQYYKNRGQ